MFGDSRSATGPTGEPRAPGSGPGSAPAGSPLFQPRGSGSAVTVMDRPGPAVTPSPDDTPAAPGTPATTRGTSDGGRAGATATASPTHREPSTRRDGPAHRDSPRQDEAATGPIMIRRAADPRTPGNGLGDLGQVAVRSLRNGTKARDDGDLDGASAALRRCHDVAGLLAVRAPDHTDALRLQADALYHLAGIQLDLGHPDEARLGLDAAEALYSQVPACGPAALADVRARRGRAHCELGNGLSALVDAQSAVLQHAGTLAGDDADQRALLGLAGALTSAAIVQARHGSSQLALNAARRASELLTRLQAGWVVDPGGQGGDAGSARAGDAGRRPPVQIRADLVAALQVEVRALRALERDGELAAPADALVSLVGIERTRDLLGEAPPRRGLDLPSAIQHVLVPDETRAAVHEMLSVPLDTVVVPGLLVEPMMLLEAAREGAATALALAGEDPVLALAAGRDAACLYAFAEELELVEHPWPQARMDLARWLWLLSELGWLAWSTGDAVLARDLADHAQHPLVRTECGRHLPASIARSVSESAVRLRQLQRALA